MSLMHVEQICSKYIVVFLRTVDGHIGCSEHFFAMFDYGDIISP